MRNTKYFIVAISWFLLCIVQTHSQEPYSVEPIIGSDEFSIIIASDPQALWKVNGDDDTDDDEKREWLLDYGKAMTKVAKSGISGKNFLKPSAVIINGDLTAFGHGSEWKDYLKFQDELEESLKVYPGLGNHDISNNFNDCAGNGCYRDSVARMRNWILSSRDELHSYDLDSLAYSFEIGKVHFIQLQYYPTFPDKKRIDSKDPLKSSISWLKDDLRRAFDGRKSIVINMHSSSDRSEWYSQGFIDTIAGYENNILGVFVGHLHSYVGYRSATQISKDKSNSATVSSNKYHYDRSIPLFYSGGAEHAFFNLVEFKNNRMLVRPIDSFKPNAPTSHTGDKLTWDKSGTNNTIRTSSSQEPKNDANIRFGAAYNCPLAKTYNTCRPNQIIQYLAKENSSGDTNTFSACEELNTNSRSTIYGLKTGGDLYAQCVAVSKDYRPRGLFFENSKAENADEFGATLAVGNFNNDNYDDLIIASPGEKLGDDLNTGMVQVAYGSYLGLSTTNKYVRNGDVPSNFHQNQPSIKDTAQDDERFGSALAVGDFNNDSIDDLAVGVPFDKTKDTAGGGVNIIYGSNKGLTDRGNQFFSQATRNIAGKVERDDQFGYALASDDFNNDGFDDLAIGVPGEDLKGRDDRNHDDGGMVQIIYGKNQSTGLDPSHLPKAAGCSGWTRDHFTQETLQTGMKIEKDDQFGYSLTTGDYNNDGYADLAIGSPFEDIGGDNDAGLVAVIFGSSCGLISKDAQHLTQDSSSVWGDAEKDDRFGWSLATVDFDNDGIDDLAIGVPQEDSAGKDDAGYVNLVYGSANRKPFVTSKKYMRFRGNSKTGNSIEKNDKFGYVLVAGNFNGDQVSGKLALHNDLVVGSPFEDFKQLDTGIATVFYQNGKGGKDLSQRKLRGTAERLDKFGSALAAGDFDNDGYDDLAVGVPGEDINYAKLESGDNARKFGQGIRFDKRGYGKWTSLEAGFVNIVYGSANGLRETRNQSIRQKTP